MPHFKVNLSWLFCSYADVYTAWVADFGGHSTFVHFQSQVQVQYYSFFQCNIYKNTHPGKQACWYKYKHDINSLCYTSPLTEMSQIFHMAYSGFLFWCTHVQPRCLRFESLICFLHYSITTTTCVGRKRCESTAVCSSPTRQRPTTQTAKISTPDVRRRWDRPIKYQSLPDAILSNARFCEPHDAL